MIFRTLTSVFLLLAFYTAPAATTYIEFYGDSYKVEYNPDILLAKPAPYGNDQQMQRHMVDFYQELDQRDYERLLTSLRNIRNAYHLNDYLYYDLLRRAVNSIYGTQPRANRRLALWHLLTKSGYDARITYIDRNVFVNIFSEDDLFEVPMIMEGNRKLINLSSFEEKDKDYARLYILDFVPNGTGSPFSFDLKDYLPQLTPRYITRRVQFGYDNTRYEIEVEVDQTLLDVMATYPFLSEDKYLEIPLSPQLRKTLVPKLRNLARGKSEREQLEMLAAFTRSGFRYKTDEEYFGRSRPMIADELFHYAYSDCEDRSALYYWLVREILDLPTIVLAYPDHVTVAVASNEELGDSIYRDGRNYYICDPTGPTNSSRIGQFPQGYARQSYDILVSYR